MYMLLYRNIFGTFILFLMLISLFVMVSCLRYFYEINFEENKIFYKKFYSRINFDFNDIVSIEKRLLDSMLILSLNSGVKIKICYLRKKYLSDFFRKLQSIRSDLFIAKTQEFPIRYYISGVYLLMFLFRVLISIFVCYISFGSIIIFLLILLIGIKVLIDDILVIKDLVIFYEFRKDSVYERKIFSHKEYFYKFFDNVFVHCSELAREDYLSFFYNHEDALKKVYINNEGMSYSMQKVFSYINKYCDKCA
ncbi:Putative membrane associated protein [Borrelia nietonii YOR]|uniref:Membrane associated protein n=1 Tax=Borrelia nietonii YOR TaxID=1293576 RepID=A0ABN4C2H1_9SPIR|nr:Putative membrane associated protein [Borrelia nietonii YOR]